MSSRIHSIRRAALFVACVWLLAGLLAALSACSDDDPADPNGGENGDNGGDGDGDYRAPLHPDSVVANFRDIYADMALDDYRDLLHEDFKFVLKNPAGALQHYDRDAEVVVADNMFSGRPDAVYGFSISSIDILMAAQGSWQDIPGDDSQFGGSDGQYRPYAINLFFAREEGWSSMVAGQAIVYTAPVQANDRTEYRLLGIVDLTGNKRASESVTWTSVKEPYYFVLE
jgi:hypothetical protein